MIDRKDVNLMTSKKTLMAIWASIVGVILVLLLLVSGWWISTSNKLNNQEQDCEQQWSQVENVMQRRYDLIPNLTASIKGSMHQEQKVFGEIAKARSAYSSAKTPVDKMKADTQLNQKTGMLINVIHEKYPQLESNQNVRDLMTQLEGSENRISTERQNYIATVRTYNQTVLNFPSSMVANAKGDRPIHYFKADSQAQSAPKVNLDN